MGGAIAVETKGKKKALDAVVNVVPFIDLLSCCLSFLLITAAWTQLSRLQVSHGGGTGCAVAPILLELSITERGFRLATGSSDAGVEIPRAGLAYDLAALKARLARVREQHPDVEAITVAAEDDVAYDTLVATIDLCVASGLESVSVQAMG